MRDKARPAIAAKARGKPGKKPGARTQQAPARAAAVPPTGTGATPRPAEPQQTNQASPRPPGKARTESAKKVEPPARKEPQPVVEAEEQQRPGALAFPVVGIGASAGGLEALEQFLRRVPEGSGMAFVVIQHLDPAYKGAMVELLQRSTPMAVTQVKDGQAVQPNCVYVIAPNKDMSIMRGALHLLPQAAPRGLNLPIDFFFRSLAEDQQERAIGVVLSGMGSDGTLGLRAIKEKAGATFVQSVDSAKFDGMPRSAIEAGLADVIADAEDLPGRVLAYNRHAPYAGGLGAASEEKQQSALEKVFILLRMQTGNDFSLYKRSTIYRRIERRMSLHQIDRMSNYVRFLRENPPEVDLLFKELLIGVTSFFRDPPAWEHLRNEILPQLIKQHPGDGTLRAWVPGCSTGEEAYSLAIVFKEALELVKPARPPALQIFATDLDKEAIERARQGVYPANIAADVSSERLRRFFVQDDRGFRVNKEIRESVVFAPQNITMDPPFTKLDILSCRNLLIYLSAELQKKLIPLFHYALNPGGVLFLGSAETVGSFTAYFAPLDGKTRLSAHRGDARGVVGRVPGRLRDATGEPTGGRATRARRGAQAPRGAPAGAGRPADRAALLAGRRGHQRAGRHPLHQRADRQVPRARRRKGHAEHLRDGPRGASLRALERLRESRTGGASRHHAGREGGDERRHADGRPHGPADYRCPGAPRLRDDGDSRRPDSARAADAGRTPEPSRRPTLGARAGRPTGARRGADRARRDANLAGGAQVDERGAPVDERGAPIEQ
jgi:chemotaxis methyl-accepting protein methylase/chemotaxis response regulator CheB